MRPPENDPDSDEIETVLEDEERGLLDKPEVPDDVKSEVNERFERYHEEELDEET